MDELLAVGAGERGRREVAEERTPAPGVTGDRGRADSRDSDRSSSAPARSPSPSSTPARDLPASTLVGVVTAPDRPSRPRTAGADPGRPSPRAPASSACRSSSPGRLRAPEAVAEVAALAARRSACSPTTARSCRAPSSTLPPARHPERASVGAAAPSRRAPRSRPTILAGDPVAARDPDPDGRGSRHRADRRRRGAGPRRDRDRRDAGGRRGATRRDAAPPEPRSVARRRPAGRPRRARPGRRLTRPLRREDGRLDPSQPAAALERQVRAYRPWPGSVRRHRLGRRDRPRGRAVAAASRRRAGHARCRRRWPGPGHARPDACGSSRASWPDVARPMAALAARGARAASARSSRCASIVAMDLALASAVEAAAAGSPGWRRAPSPPGWPNAVSPATGRGRSPTPCGAATVGSFDEAIPLPAEPAPEQLAAAFRFDTVADTELRVSRRRADREGAPPPRRRCRSSSRS